MLANVYLGKFLVNNYIQALDVLGGKTTLDATMKSKGLTDFSVFKMWLQEEQTHLLALKREPPEESLHMEYLQKLQLMMQLTAQLGRAQDRFRNVTAETIHNRDDTRSIETAQRNAGEKLDRAINDIHLLEECLVITTRWTPDCAEWIVTSALLKGRVYQRALDTLESLVIARLFELTKMNQSQTGQH